MNSPTKETVNTWTCGNHLMCHHGGEKWIWLKGITSLLKVSISMSIERPRDDGVATIFLVEAPLVKLKFIFTITWYVPYCNNIVNSWQQFKHRSFIAAYRYCRNDNGRQTICFGISIAATSPISPQIPFEANRAKMKGIWGEMGEAATIDPSKSACSNHQNGIGNDEWKIKLWWLEVLH